MREGSENEPGGDEKSGDHDDPPRPEPIVEPAYGSGGDGKDDHVEEEYGRDEASAPSGFPNDGLEHDAEGELRTRVESDHAERRSDDGHAPTVKPAASLWRQSFYVFHSFPIGEVSCPRSLYHLQGQSLFTR